jgi:hypothetical protein
VLGTGDCNCPHERGIPRRRESSARVDYVPVLCTHRPSLHPIERSSEVFGLDGPAVSSRVVPAQAGLAGWRVDVWKVARAGWLRGGISRNKVSVGEPAEGSCNGRSRDCCLAPRPLVAAALCFSLIPSKTNRSDTKVGRVMLSPAAAFSAGGCFHVLLSHSGRRTAGDPPVRERFL